MKDLWHESAEFVATLRRSTGLFPFLVMNLITGFLTLFSNSKIQIYMFIVFAITILGTLICCFYFMITDPNRLGSEKQVLQNRALDMLADEGHNLGTTAEHIVSVINPKNNILESDKIEISDTRRLQIPNQLPTK